FQRARVRRRMDERWRNYKGGTEHRRRRDVDRCEFARRIEIQRVAALGMQLANACRARKTNAHRSRDRFTWPNATSAARSRSRNLYDQSSASDRSRSAVIDVQNFELLVIPTQTPNAVIHSEAKDHTYGRPISHRQVIHKPS